MARIGVLALQGAFREHVKVLRALGADAVEVRLPSELRDLDGLVIPGGESTTVGKLMEGYGLTDPLREFVRRYPVLGTCAGLIVLARSTTGGEQPLLGVMDVVVRRNAFGRQVHSFEAPVSLEFPGGSWDRAFPGVFIRAPWVEEAGPEVEVVAVCEGHVVGVRQGDLIGLAFHPELTDDSRIHEYFLGVVERKLEAMPLAVSVAK
jgi:pyridoxal 5'-phosphate synthase pdxT subunit